MEREGNAGQEEQRGEQQENELEEGDRIERSNQGEMMEKQVEGCQQEGEMTGEDRSCQSFIPTVHDGWWDGHLLSTKSQQGSQ
ncbi:hypothetical protein DPX16_9213 [Anabarilius grahami]|uniref:Uncharacterized protein n=1 Tax=Anabarilius grahami TaxID=495550 RepID=A0A3N0Y802_ANAGA|nr:hypothetical protein DPX16_9213 [Anabarilius grahami]